jgi:hypothetical protein
MFHIVVLLNGWSEHPRALAVLPRLLSSRPAGLCERHTSVIVRRTDEVKLNGT